MKKLNRSLVIALSVLIMAGICQTAPAQALTTDLFKQADVVTEPSKAGALWTASFSDPYFMGTSMTSTPIVTDSFVYVVNKDSLYELDKKTGKTLRELSLPVRMNSVCDPVLQDGRLYIPLSDGIITCIDTTDMQILWTSENMSQKYGMVFQTLGRLRLYDGYLYAGTWCRAADKRSRLSASDNSISGPGSAGHAYLSGNKRVNIDHEIASDGVFFCIDTKDGHTVWTYRNAENPVGFYWTESVMAHGRLFFNSEDGTLISHSPTGDVVYEKVSLTDGLMLRNGLCASPDGNYLFTVSKAGILIKITLDTDGNIKSVDKAPLITGEAVGHLSGSGVPENQLPVSDGYLLTESNGTPDINCTSTPTYCNGTLYTGCAVDGCGYMCVTDASTLKLRYAAQGKPSGEIKSHPLVVRENKLTSSGSSIGIGGGDTEESTLKTSEESTSAGDIRHIYFTANENTGSLYHMTDTPAADSGKIETLFTPYSAKQYCLADVAIDDDGILYYSNDSGTLFAIGETDKSADIPDTIKVDKPYGVKIKPIKKGWKLTWKKKQPEARTEIFIKNNNKWKLYKDKKKCKEMITYKSIKKMKLNNNSLKIKLRCYVKKSDTKSIVKV
ncbi:MAG: PQQ-binding-like beta-propeller repeat protein [Eubacterium sp.]|nr:PQQ-binding-like beta-propeller repeat protein [Eubacterium sp.]